MSDASLGPALRGAVDLSSLRNRPQQPADQGGQGAPQQGAPQGGAPGPVMAVDDRSFGQIMELSQTVPVVVQLWAQQVPQTVELGTVLEEVARSYGGRLVLARIEAGSAPQVMQMFQQNGWPMSVGLIGQRPVPLPDGVAEPGQIRELFDQILQLAEKAGVTGTVPAGDAPAEEPDEKELPPLHQEAFDAIQRADYAGAIAAYEKALTQNPRDEEAQAGLGQVALLQRVQGLDLEQVRREAAERPADVDAQLAVADLDVSGGHIDDAFGRLLDLFQTLAGDDRQRVQARLVELFGLVGQSDPRVLQARARLSSMLF